MGSFLYFLGLVCFERNFWGFNVYVIRSVLIASDLFTYLENRTTYSEAYQE